MQVVKLDHQRCIGGQASHKLGYRVEGQPLQLLRCQAGHLSLRRRRPRERRAAGRGEGTPRRQPSAARRARSRCARCGLRLILVHAAQRPHERACKAITDRALVRERLRTDP